MFANEQDYSNISRDPTFGLNNNSNIYHRSSRDNSNIYESNNNYPIYQDQNINNNNMNNNNNINNNNINNNNFTNQNNNNQFGQNLVNNVSEQIKSSFIDKLKCNISFLQVYFDIDTDDIKNRLISSLNPLNSNFIQLIKDKPDLYGPFWIYTTIIFIIAASGSFSKYLQGANDADYFQEFVPTAAYVIYGVGFCLPFIIFILMYFFGSQTNFMIILCIYAYSFTIYAPVMIVIIPFEKIQGFLLFLAVLSSTIFILVNFFAEMNKYEDNKKYLIIGVIILFQISLFLILKFNFFKKLKKRMIT